MIDKAKDFILDNKLEITCVLASSALFHIINILKAKSKRTKEQEAELALLLPTLETLSTLHTKQNTLRAASTFPQISSNPRIRSSTKFSISTIPPAKSRRFLTLSWSWYCLC